jgi:hypothetical protein
MRRFVRNLVTVVAAVALVALLLVWANSGWRPLPSFRGQLTARIDVARGQYKILTFGLPSADRPQYATLLRQRYGVEMKVVAGCVVTPSLLDYVAAYNNVSGNAIKHKFGHDVFQEIHDEVKKSWEQTHR